jgi:hypothetical protein
MTAQSLVAGKPIERVDLDRVGGRLPDDNLSGMAERCSPVSVSEIEVRHSSPKNVRTCNTPASELGTRWVAVGALRRCARPRPCRLRRYLRSGLVCCAARRDERTTGLFFHHRERLDTNEDAALERAASDPEPLEQAVTWVQQLQNGERIRVGWFATLTPAGVEWSGLRTSSIRWDSVEHITPWTMSVRGGIRAGRGVRIRVPGKSMVISCSKSNFADVLATCAEMARSCS